MLKRNIIYGAQAVYEKYKHLDHLLSDPEWMPDTMQGQILLDLWQTVKNIKLKEDAPKTKD